MNGRELTHDKNTEVVNPDFVNPISILPEDKFIQMNYEDSSRVSFPKELERYSAIGGIGPALMTMGKRIDFDENFKKL